MSGVLELTAEAYHADPSEHPSLSASIAHILCTQSPRHAWTAHPKLNPHWARTDDQKFDVGTVAHAMILEGRDIVYVIYADDWRTKVAKEEREYARSLGKIPLLARHRDEVYAMVDAVRAQLDTHGATPALFADGKPEQTLLWEEDGVACKARLDWLRDDMATIDDLKTTSWSANPAAYSRSLFGVGGDVQAAFYLRGLRQLTSAEASFRWVVVETSPPYALSVITPGSDVLALGEAKVEWAIRRWGELLALDGEWPAYPTEVATAEMPAWEETRWLEQVA